VHFLSSFLLFGGSASIRRPFTSNSGAIDGLLILCRFRMDLKRWQKERFQGPRIFLLEWTAKSPAVAVTGCRNQKQSAIALHNPGSGPHGGGGNHPDRVHFPFLVKWVGRRPPTLAGDKQRDTAPQLGNKQTVLRENGALRRAECIWSRAGDESAPR
jgi:hypothetical protein